MSLVFNYIEVAIECSKCPVCKENVVLELGIRCCKPQKSIPGQGKSGLSKPISFNASESMHEL